MQKKILIVVDGSFASRLAVEYVGLMGGEAIRELSVTLLGIMKPVPHFIRWEAQRDRYIYKQLKTLESKNGRNARAVMERARERLLRHGMEEDQIETKVLPRTSEPAHGIIFEAEQGLYDAVVLGRRGLSKTHELFMGGVTRKVLQHAHRIPIWIVGGRISKVKVLCPVDGSEESLRAVDHMAFMLGENPECEVTLFHAGPPIASYCPIDFGEEIKEIEGELMHVDAECMNDFCSRAVRVLTEAGISWDQVKTKSVDAPFGVSKAIIREVRREGYGTVVLGRRDEDRVFFLSRVTDKLASKCDKAAVWVVG